MREEVPGELRQWGGAQAPGEHIQVVEPNVSIAAWMERYPGSWEPRNKINKSHRRDW